MSLLDLPHHDGSPLHVSDESPRLGDVVTVRVRTSAADPVDAVWLRTTYDAEPVFHPMTASTDGDTTWWSGELPVHNPVTHYRFLLVRTGDGQDEQEWLTAAGPVGIDVPDATDHVISAYAAAPDWGRDGVVYQVFPDRFARSAAADERPTPAVGDRGRLGRRGHLRAARPAHPAPALRRRPRRHHRAPRPRRGGGRRHRLHDPGLPRREQPPLQRDHLRPGRPAARRRRGLRAALDRRARPRLADPRRPHHQPHRRHPRVVHRGGRRPRRPPTRSYYYFEPDGTYASWMGHTTLPKVNHGDPDLRAAMVEGPDSVVGRWLRPPYDVDGWRIDVANMTGRLGALDVAHDVARAARHTAAELRDDPLVIGEHNHDATGDIDGDGWHGTMNYSGFSWPLWSWLRDPATPARAFGRPVPGAPATRRGGRRDVPRLARGLRLAGHLPVLEHPRLPRLRPDPHPGRRERTCTGWRPACSSRCRASRWSSPATRSASRASPARTRAAPCRGTAATSGTPTPWRRTPASPACAARTARCATAGCAGPTSTTTPSPSCARLRRPAPAGGARRAGGDAFTLPTADRATHLLGTEPGGADLEGSGGEVVVPATAGARLDVWRLDG